MEFPSRSGGAQGGLIKGNLFAQSGMPAYSNTRHGDSVIHTMDGRISITRNDQGTPPPYLLLPYYSNGAPRLIRTAAEGGGEETDTEVSYEIGQTVTGRGVFVGDGYFLCMQGSSDSTASRPVLVSIYGPDTPLVDATSAQNLPGENVQLDAPWLMDDSRADGRGNIIMPTPMACGWRDEARRYSFAVFGVLDDGPSSVYASRYACIVGDTGTRTATVHLLPTLEDSTIPLLRNLIGPVQEYKTSWWGSEMIYGVILLYLRDMPTSARCYCVGPGHLLTLLTPQERIGQTEGVALSGPYTVGYIAWDWLPAGSAPYLLRSRDYGETWTMERADFLVADEAPTTEHNQSPYNDGDPETTPPPLQRVGDFGSFIAAPMGNGRVAIAALGKNEGPTEYDSGGPFSRVGRNCFDRSWRFYISGTNGTGFVRKPWPMDSMRSSRPSVYLDLDPSLPRQRTYEHPTFDPWVRPQRAYSFGPGHFILPTIKYSVDMGPGVQYDWGTYPQDYPVTVWSTYDFGDTWVGEQLPPELMPYANTLAVYYDAYPKGVFEPSSDARVCARIAFGCVDPATPGEKPVLTYMAWDLDGSAPISVSMDDAAPVGSLAVVAGLVSDGTPQSVTDYSMPSNWVASNSSEVFYTGDLRSATRPELVYPGYPEFEEPT